eukprot:TRINITY_DN212_c2_g1_i2.p1 TRINITY_DN212_c2_g1~~TRINITY_DN212_c2_g1_i2.p1  ORF type:complete len:419 (-),score=40.31 TRINITY_DN212_c2_g1_i2:247-1503(-)
MGGLELGSLMYIVPLSNMIHRRLGGQMFHILVREAVRRAGALQTTDLMYVMMAIGHSNQMTEDWQWDKLLAASRRNLSRFQGRELCSLCYAVARRGWKAYDPDFFDNLLRIATSKIEELDLADTRTILWSLSSLGHYDQRFMRLCADHIADLGLENATAFQLVTIIHVFARFNYFDEDFLVEAVKVVESKLDEMEFKEICLMLYSWALLMQVPSDALGAVRALITRPEMFNKPSGENQKELKQWQSCMSMVALSQSLFRIQGEEIALPEELEQKACVGLKTQLGQVVTLASQEREGLLDEICMSLIELGFDREMSRWVLSDDGAYVADIVLKLTDRRVALVYGSKQMYTRSKPRLKMGELLATERGFIAQGWSFIDIPYFHWEEVEHHKQRKEYLLHRIKLALEGSENPKMPLAVVAL